MKSAMFAALMVCMVVAVDGRAGMAQESDLDWTTVGENSAARWTVTAGSLLLNRSKARPGSLVFDGTTDAELSNVADFDLGWAAGPQIELSRCFDSGWDVALRYFSIDGWSASHSLADPGNLRVPMVSNDPDDFFDTAYARYASRLYNTEVNLKRRWGERVKLLAGFRWVELHEQIASGAYSPGLEGTFDVGAANYLYGFQMGAESMLIEYGALRFDGFLKAGVYGNSVRGTIRGEGTYYDEDSTGTASHTSFLGEIGLTAKYQFNRHISAYGGYQVMWLQGVVLAGDFVSSLVNPSAELDPLDGAAFYHGAQAGLEFAW
jgi:hypothetical protein